MYIAIINEVKQVVNVIVMDEITSDKAKEFLSLAFPYTHTAIEVTESTGVAEASPYWEWDGEKFKKVSVSAQGIVDDGTQYTWDESSMAWIARSNDPTLPPVA
jgi:hypothetical protein